MFKNKNGSLGIFIVILFFFLIIAVIFLFIFLNGNDSEKYRPIENNTQNITYWNITISTNANSKVNYILSNQTNFLVKGMIFPNIKELYEKGIENNTNITLLGYSEAYYMNITTCTILKNKQDCRINMKEKALDYDITLTPDYVIIDPKNKTIQAPIKICWKEKFNVQNVIMNLTEIATPKELKKEIDFCYVEKNDISKFKIYSINIKKSEVSPNETMILRVFLIDFEEMGYENIGMKDAGILI